MMTMRLRRATCLTLTVAAALAWLGPACGGESAIKIGIMADMANSAVGFAVAEVAKPLNKIVLVTGPGSSDFTGKACAPTIIHWTWDTYAAASGVARALVGPDTRTWFVIASDFAFGHALERDGAAAVEKLGG